MIKDFTALKKNLKKDFVGLKNIKVALLGDSSTQLLNQAIKAYGFELDVDFEIYESDYNQVERQLLDTSSELYQFEPEFVVVFESAQKLAKSFYNTPKNERTFFADRKIKRIKDYYEILSGATKAKIIYYNFIEQNDSIFGNYSNKTEFSFLYQVRKINYVLMNLSQSCKNLFVCDLQLIAANQGREQSFDAKMHYSADMDISINLLPFLAKHTSDIVASISGKFKKCLILDLDNTLWGGIIGDDGLEKIELGDLGLGNAFTELQVWVKQLKERGIIIAVCSKNDEQIAKEPFEKHPDMVLRLEDIAVFVANWNNKADNIRHIQQILNIGFDSMVFLDDNPFERNLVRENLPDVFVPELPEDPALYLEYLHDLNIFETASFSDEDEMRNDQYRQEASRAITQKNFTNEEDFLKSLNMVSEVKPFNTFNFPRVVQLSQRSNQFNLRTIRYSEEDVQKIAVAENYFSLTFDLKDKFGNNGLICVIVLKKEQQTLFIETWLMSCRVLKRGMENFVLNAIQNVAKQNGFLKIKGQYIATAKNAMVKNHYENLGFTKTEEMWELDVNHYEIKGCFIQSQ
jgi:FkbH-like protein